MSPRYPINSILTEDARKEFFGRKKQLIALINAIFEFKGNATRGKKHRNDLGMDEWDGFTWAGQRQSDGKRVGRAWDQLKREWTVVRNLELERSVSPCEVRRALTAEGEEEKEEAGGEIKHIGEGYKRDGWPANGSLHRGEATTEYQDDITHAETLLWEHCQAIAIIGSQSVMAADCNHESFVQKGRPENDDDAIIHPPGTVGEIFPERTRSSGLVIDDSEEVSPYPYAQATMEYFSDESPGIWKATINLVATKPWKRIVFWKLGNSRSLEQVDAHSESRGAAHLASSQSQNLSVDSSESELNGLAKLLGSIDDMRVNRVRHIWHAETGHWTHERTEIQKSIGDALGG